MQICANLCNHARSCLHHSKTTISSLLRHYTYHYSQLLIKDSAAWALTKSGLTYQPWASWNEIVGQIHVLPIGLPRVSHKSPTAKSNTRHRGFVWISRNNLEVAYRLRVWLNRAKIRWSEELHVNLGRRDINLDRWVWRMQRRPRIHIDPVRHFYPTQTTYISISQWILGIYLIYMLIISLFCYPTEENWNYPGSHLSRFLQAKFQHRQASSMQVMLPELATSWWHVIISEDEGGLLLGHQSDLTELIAVHIRISLILVVTGWYASISQALPVSSSSSSSSPDLAVCRPYCILLHLITWISCLSLSQ